MRDNTVHSVNQTILEDLKRGIEANLKNSERMIEMSAANASRQIDENYHESLKIYSEGYILLKENKLQDAKKSLERSLELNPDLTTAYPLLCYIHILDKDFDSVSSYLVPERKVPFLSF